MRRNFWSVSWSSSRVAHAFAGTALGLSMGACGAPQDHPAKAPACPSAEPTLAPVPPPPPSPSGDLDAAERLTLVRELVDRVHALHVFSQHTKDNLGLDWDRDDLPALRDEFARADSRDKLSVALWHFGNSLHDMHCNYRAPSRAQVTRMRIKLGVEEKGAAFEYYVAEIWDKSIVGLEPGDIIESADGVAAADLARVHRNEGSFNNWPQLAIAAGRFLTRRRNAESLTRDGDVSKWVVRSRKTGDKKTVELTWKERVDDDLPDDSWVDYADEDCGDADPAKYDGYKLSGHGAHFCMYVADKPPRSFYPIVRQVSFRYFADGAQEFLADHDSLTLRLSLQKQAKGVILDMRENGGGNDPNSFVDWWAPARPYTDTFTVMRKTQLVGDREALEKFVVNTPKAVKDFYMKCVKEPGDEPFCAKRPFECKPDTCDWNNEFVASHQVTKLPVALLIGPNCGSSCDAFVYTWKKNAFGPLIGMPSMAGFTTNRYRAPIPGRLPLGTIDLAFSYDVSADGDMVEGHLIPPDVRIPPTWDNYAKYDSLLADAAIKALGERRWRSSTVSPR